MEPPYVGDELLEEFLERKLSQSEEVLLCQEGEGALPQNRNSQFYRGAVGGLMFALNYSRINNLHDVPRAINLCQQAIDGGHAEFDFFEGFICGAQLAVCYFKEPPAGGAEALIELLMGYSARLFFRAQQADAACI